ncbi:MAG: MBL fold metallo-hydrolase [Defluviitaleaceae bacterium]|nr:MBL fold metallo-hydrolase [Defluviitaleaceae bacterium]
MKLEFCTVASGSSGNASCIGIGGQHFLVDAGVSGKRIENAMFQMNVRELGGIFLTHEHRDHIAGAGVMARRFKVNLYATPLTWRYFAANRSLGELNAEQIKVIEPEKPINVAGVKVTAFDINHDAAQPVGYTFEALGKKIATATDLGCATDTVRKHLKGSQVVLLESNHDPVMLKNGPYHQRLKERVASTHGHLSNADAGVLLSEIACEKLEHVFLAHLSEDNNTHMLAHDTVKRILDGNNVKLKNLIVADRHMPGQVVRCD